MEHLANPRSVMVPGLSRPIQVKIASDRDEFEQAFRLVSHRYRSRGYVDADGGTYRFTPHHALPGTVTFVAHDDDRVVATLSMVPDNATLGLPMESLYGDEVKRLRDAGKVLAEVTCLAELGLRPHEFHSVFRSLIRLNCQYHVLNGGDTWVIAVNPRHRGYYRKAFGFQPLGPVRAYPKVGHHPAEAFYLDVDGMRVDRPAMHDRIFREPLPPSVLTPVSWPADHADYFAEADSC